MAADEQRVSKQVKSIVVCPPNLDLPIKRCSYVKGLVCFPLNWEKMPSIQEEHRCHSHRDGRLSSCHPISCPSASQSVTTTLSINPVISSSYLPLRSRKKGRCNTSRIDSVEEAMAFSLHHMTKAANSTLWKSLIYKISMSQK